MIGRSHLAGRLPLPLHAVRLRLAVLVALLCLPLVAVAAPGASGAAAPALRFGFTDDQGIQAFPASVPIARKAGLTFARVYVGWADVATRRPVHPRDPNDPAYDWSVPDATIAPYKGTGVELMGALWRVPAWANGGNPPIVWPLDARDYGDFAYAASKRYPQITWWLPYNEPNLRAFAQPDTVQAYEPVERAVYAAIKQADPRDSVAAGSLARNTGAPEHDVWLWARTLHDDGVPMDGFAVHPYPGWTQPISVRDPAHRFDIWDLAALGRLVGVPVLSMEFGWSTKPGFVSYADQAAWLRDAIWVARCTPGLARFTLWGFHDHQTPPGADPDFWGQFGLLDAQSQPKPALAAVHDAIAAPLACDPASAPAGAPAGWPDSSQPELGSPLLGTPSAQPDTGAVSATVDVPVDPHGYPTTVRVELGADPSYGATSAPVQVDGALGSTAVAVPLSGLAPLTTYHYRVLADNAWGSAAGDDATFTTPAAPPPLPLIATPAAPRPPAGVGSALLAWLHVDLRGGAHLRIRLGAAASLTVRIARLGARRSTRWLRPGTLVAGVHDIVLPPLRPGRYRLTVVARSAAGASSARVRVLRVRRRQR